MGEDFTGVKGDAKSGDGSPGCGSRTVGREARLPALEHKCVQRTIFFAALVIVALLPTHTRICSARSYACV
ncbi:hypothetical protein KIN20_015393 [Parelaphostrongylus tenuis]|uniref:Uncharacterized protein n=1 Tax=Parelaphostrongylus tenuis TaxID=148309 RepID=A0AAD5MG03_PARTN|nr:hypothetical protein KIN20_015393 [Parelaphostrongylus tenuis]